MDVCRNFKDVYKIKSVFTIQSLDTENEKNEIYDSSQIQEEEEEEEEESLRE